MTKVNNFDCSFFHIWFLSSEVKKLNKNNIRLNVIGVIGFDQK